MSTGGKTQLKGEVKRLAAECVSGIDLDTPLHWVIEGVNSPVAFFKNLSLLIPPGSILYVEGTSVVPELVSFYENHPAHNVEDVIRDTIYPEPHIYHFSFSPEVLARLEDPPFLSP